MAAGGCMAAARGAAFTATSPLAGYLAATAGDRCCGEPLLPLRLRCVSSSSSSSSPSSSPMTGIPHACGCATRSRVPNAVFAVLGADRQKHAGNVRSGLRHLEDTLRTLRAHTASRRGLHEPCRLLQRYGVEEGAERRRRIRGTTISASSSDRPDTDEAKAQAPNPAPVKTNLGTSSAAQLLGMKGAKAGETNIWKIRLQLTKPVTWVPLIWGVMCGAAASGHFEWTPEDVAKSIGCMILSGPLLTGYTQTMNDWYDREIDAINEPYRPIPSGAISSSEVISQIWVLLLGGLAVGYGLDLWAGHDFPTILGLAIFGSFISYIYSAPPLKLKQSGWLGNYALGSSYISLPWWAGQAMFGTLAWDVVVLTLLYSIAGLGIAIVNDFKSIEGDRKLGLRSLPVEFGVDTAKWICVGSIDITQLSVAAYLYFAADAKIYAAVLLGLILPQMFFQAKYFLPDPVANDVKYQASAQPFLVFGILTTALAIGHQAL